MGPEAARRRRPAALRVHRRRPRGEHPRRRARARTATCTGSGPTTSTGSPRCKMAMSSETANKYFQGKENVAVAIARRRIKSGGDVKAALSLIPITKPIYAQLPRDARGASTRTWSRSSGQIAAVPIDTRGSASSTCAYRPTKATGREVGSPMRHPARRRPRTNAAGRGSGPHCPQAAGPRPRSRRFHVSAVPIVWADERVGRGRRGARARRPACSRRAAGARAALRRARLRVPARPRRPARRARRGRRAARRLRAARRGGRGRGALRRAVRAARRRAGGPPRRRRPAGATCRRGRATSATRAAAQARAAPRRRRRRRPHRDRPGRDRALPARRLARAAGAARHAGARGPARAPAARRHARGDRGLLRGPRAGLARGPDATRTPAFARNRIRHGLLAGAARRCTPPPRPTCCARSTLLRDEAAVLDAAVDAALAETGERGRGAARRCRPRCARLALQRLADRAGGRPPAVGPRADGDPRARRRRRQRGARPRRRPAGRRRVRAAAVRAGGGPRPPAPGAARRAAAVPGPRRFGAAAS